MLYIDTSRPPNTSNHFYEPLPVGRLEKAKSVPDLLQKSDGYQDVVENGFAFSLDMFEIMRKENGKWRDPNSEIPKEETLLPALLGHWLS